MFGATLSRWTLSYFASSLAFLIAGVGLMVEGFGYPFHGIRAPETLILVHIIAIGWLALLMGGALCSLCRCSWPDPYGEAVGACPPFFCCWRDWSAYCAALPEWQGLGAARMAPAFLWASVDRRFQHSRADAGHDHLAGAAHCASSPFPWPSALHVFWR